MNNLGLMLLEQGQSDEAAALLGQSRGVAEGRRHVPQQPGHGPRAHRQFTAAAAAYKGALDADPGYEKAKRNLARVEAVKVSSEEKSVGEAKQPLTEKSEKTETATAKQ